MSVVDVTTEIVIARPRAHVAAYVEDAENATRWHQNIKRRLADRVRRATPRPGRSRTSTGRCRRWRARTVNRLPLEG